jgi:protein-L-isoaspartate(D-aspartate) O-methyltransferase
MKYFKTPQSNDALIDMISKRRDYLGLDGFDARALEAMRRIDRAAFAPPDAAGDPYEDEPFRIAHNQTCSQPSMVAAMATMLELRPGLRVLEVGAGSGYSAAVTAQLIHPGGALISIEYIPELTAFARKNLKSQPNVPDNIELLTGDGSAGVPARAPFDRIFFTAGAGAGFNEAPLLAQLSDGGILLYPEAFGSMFLARKTRSGFEKRQMHGVGFVFLRGKNSGFD